MAQIRHSRSRHFQDHCRPTSIITSCVSRLLPSHNSTCIGRWHTSRLSVLGANRNLQAQPRRLHDQNQRRPFEATGIRQVSFDRADFILEIYCPPQVVERLMGHKHDSTAISEYISEISTTDAQALSRGIAVSNITQMSNIRLGRVADAPTGPSETAFQAPSK